MSIFHKNSIIEELEEDAKKAIRWVAAEYSFLKDLKQDLEDIKKDEKISEEEKDFRKAQRALRYVGRSQRKSNQWVEKVEDDLEELARYDPVISTLTRKIEIDSRKLVKAFSFYKGTFKRELAELISTIKTKEKQIKKGKEEKVKQAEENIKRVASEIEEHVDNLIKWIDGLEIELKQAEQVIEKIHKKGILIVDDKEEYRAAAELFFKTIPNVKVFFAKDYDEAMNLFSDKLGGVITDCFFPKQTGSADTRLGMKVIEYLTGDRSEEYQIDEYNTMKEYLEKSPINQPLGVLIAKKAKKLSIPVVLATDTHHHGKATEPINGYSRHGDNNDNYKYMILVDSDSGKKTSQEFWKAAYDALRKLAF